MQTYSSHHGILGMKWGVRRYQNKDGTLTEAGKARARKVEGNKSLSERDKRDAIKRLKYKQSLYANDYKEAFLKASLYGAIDRADAEEGKLDKRVRMLYQQNLAFAHIYAALYQAETKRLEDISSGTLKAGRDFIVQRDWNYIPLPIMSRTYVPIEKTNKR